jgi:hypothetical protein
MSEQVYEVSCWDEEKQEWGTMGIQFSEMDNEWACLCTFDPEKSEVDIDVIRSFALLGAAVVLAHIGKLEHSFLPFNIPPFICDKIKRLLPYADPMSDL